MSSMAVAQEASTAVRLEPAVSAAAERLFQQHAGWIYGYCLRQLRSPEEAEDALQATYLNACRSLNGGFEPRADSAWLFKVAQNVCITRLRSSGRRALLERPQDRGVLEETVAAPERRSDELIGLPEAMATLPELQRRAILLREWQGLSYREVAEELDLTQSAVETLLFRARRSLATALESPEGRRPRALHSFNFAGLGAALKSLLAGGAGVKVAATVAVATTATVVALDPVGWHRVPAQDSAPKPVVRGVEQPPSTVRTPAASHLPAERAEHIALASTPAVLEEGPRGREVADEKRAAKADRVSRGKAKGKDKAKAKGQAHGRGPDGQGPPGQAKAPGESARAEAGSGPPTFAGSGGPPAQASAKGKSTKSK